MKNKTRLFQSTATFVIVIALAATLIITGCDGDETTGPQNPVVVDVVISPETAELEVGEELDFSAFALTAAGDTVDISDLNIEWNWWSNDPDVFTVEPGGLATGQSPGEAYCIVEATVEVGLNFNQNDVSIAGIGFSLDGLNKIQLGSFELSAGDQGDSAFENVSFKKKMRFTGRDSAFVMVF